MGATNMRKTIAGTMLALLAAGCAHRDRPAPPPAEPPAPVETPTPPPPPPAPTINSDVGPEEALWHLRAALNVAALSCGQAPGGAAIVARYNAFLADRKAPLAAAYAAEKALHGSAPGDLDRHMTQLYNFFADPLSQRGFCAAAGPVAEQVAATAGDALAATAPAALVQLEAPYIASRRTPAARVADTMAAVSAAPAVAPAAAPWRIQIGAFTGQSAAQAAWRKALARVPSLSAYQPSYEPVPGKPLVRLRVGAATDRTGAIRLCAAAAAGGFDCMPIGTR